MTMTDTLTMANLLVQIQDTLFDATDTVSLERAEWVAQAYRQHANQPIPIKRAMALNHLLAHMSLDMQSNPVFAGNTSPQPRAWMLIPEASWQMPGQVSIEHDEFTPQWLDEQIPQSLKDTWRQIGQTESGGGGVGHLSIDYGMVVGEGLQGVLKRLDQPTRDCSEAQIYRKAMRLTCEALIKWAHRLADHAEQLAQTCDDPTITACHQRVAKACRHVPQYPARNFFEALQGMLLIHLAMALEGQGQSISIGLPDRALAAFIPQVNDDFDGSVQLIRAFLVGVASNSYTGRGSKTQAITLGGAKPDGSDASNVMTMAFLCAFEQTPVADPHCFLRWHPQVDSAIWDKVISLLSKGRSMPLLVNDLQVVPGLIDSGVSVKDAWDYCIIGCNELGIPGRLSECSACYGLSVNDLKLLNQIVRKNPEQFQSTQQIVKHWGQTFKEELVTGVPRRQKLLQKHRQQLPMMVSSCFCHGCAESGSDWVDGQRYHLPGIYTRGTANAINALAAIQKLVFEEHRYTLRQMLQLLDSDDQRIYQDIQAAPKWGNDDDTADQWARALGIARMEAMEEAQQESAPNTNLFMLCHVVRSLHYMDGRNLGATLDGRKAFEPVGDSIAAICGTTTQGPTAILNSVLKINALGEFRGIYNNNLTLPGNQASLNILKPLVEAFFMDGGQELQINVLDAQKLLAAKANPSAYKDLVVRIAGLNARFIELSQAEQNEIIRRAQMA